MSRPSSRRLNALSSTASPPTTTPAAAPRLAARREIGQDVGRLVADEGLAVDRLQAFAARAAVEPEAEDPLALVLAGDEPVPVRRPPVLPGVRGVGRRAQERQPQLAAGPVRAVGAVVDDGQGGAVRFRDEGEPFLGHGLVAVRRAARRRRRRPGR